MLISPDAFLPEVSFAIDLGKKYSNAEFDYDAFERMIYSMGGTADDYTSAKVHISKPEMGGLFQGGIDPGTGDIHNGAFRYRINTNLAHETRHYLDLRQEKLSTASAVAGNISIYGFLGISLVDISARVATYIPDGGIRHIAQDTMNVAFPLVVFAIGAVGSLYFLSPQERRARKAAKNDSEQVITLTK